MRLHDVQTASLPVKPGELIGGRYRIDRVLGQGGMAVVVSAKDERLDETVAIKVLLPERVSNVDARERFAREARTAVKIKNEHVVRVTDVGDLPNGIPYMVMEYLEGEDLASLLARKKRVPAPTAMFYVLQVCSALNEAHGLGVVHRDLKPANLFLAQKRGQPPSLKVLDFGISKFEAHDRRRTETKEILGSPWYMAPEQMKRAASADARADVWSLGIILHELVTGEVPFDGASMTEVIVTVLHDEPTISHVGDMPPSLERVIRKCLAKSPADRFASADDLAAALREADVPQAEAPSESLVAAVESVDEDDDDDDDDGEVVDESELIPSANPPPTAFLPTKSSAAAAVAAASAAITEREDSEAKLAAEVELLDDEHPLGLPVVRSSRDERQRTTTRPRRRPAPAAITAPSPTRSEKRSGTYFVVASGLALVVLAAAWRRDSAAKPSPEPTTKESLPITNAASAETPPVASAEPAASAAVDPDPGPTIVTVADPPITVTPTPAAVPTSAPHAKPELKATVAPLVAAPTPTFDEDDNTVASAAARNHYTALRQACWDSSDKTTFLVTVATAVNPTGTVASADGAGADAKLARCVAEQVRTWTFPPSKKARSLQIPIRFRR